MRPSKEIRTKESGIILFWISCLALTDNGLDETSGWDKMFSQKIPIIL